MAEPRKPARWTIARARQQLPTLISSAAREPQAVYRRDELVATVVGAELGKELEEARAQQRRRPMADALAELRQICTDEDYSFPEVPRQARGQDRGQARGRDRQPPSRPGGRRKR